MDRISWFYSLIPARWMLFVLHSFNRMSDQYNANVTASLILSRSIFVLIIFHFSNHHALDEHRKWHWGACCIRVGSVFPPWPYARWNKVNSHYECSVHQKSKVYEHEYPIQGHSERLVDKLYINHTLKKWRYQSNANLMQKCIPSPYKILAPPVIRVDFGEINARGCRNKNNAAICKDACSSDDRDGVNVSIMLQFDICISFKSIMEAKRRWNEHTGQS